MLEQYDDVLTVADLQEILGQYRTEKSAIYRRV